MSLLRYESQAREPLVTGAKTYHQVTEDIIRPIEMKPSRLWYIGFFISVGIAVLWYLVGYHGGDLWCGPVEPE